MYATHRPLNSKQLDILRLLYRFRFGTTELFTQALETNSKIKMNERLKILLDQEYIGRNYEPEYRLLRRHATYYLRTKGVKALKQSEGNYDDAVLRNIRNDKNASEQFIDHCLKVFAIYCGLKMKYGKALRFFTKSQLGQYDYFPKPLPDAFIRLELGGREKQYFVEVLQSARPFFVSVRKARRYIDFADEGEWEVAGTKLPTILLSCDNETLLKRLEKHIGNLDEIDEDLEFIVTSDVSEALPKAVTREKPEAA